MILPYDPRNRLCLASACFNTLKLREYPTEDELGCMLERSVGDSAGFQEGLE